MDKGTQVGGATTPPGLRHWGAGIFSIDSGYVRPGFDAIHLIIESDRAVLVDSGTVHAVPRVLAALEALGIARENVDWVLLTHVHLDHAGGAGALLQALPAARATVHPRGARHLVDPSKLWQATVEVYGRAEAESAYGQIVPIAPDRLVETGDGATVRFAGRELSFIDTPGHARHHVVIRDGATGHLFTGDMFGISYRDLDVDDRVFIIPSATPTQFDPDDTVRSIDRLLALAPDAVYLTHYAQRRDVATLGARLKRLTRRYVAIAEQALADEGLAALDEPAIATQTAGLQARIRDGLTALYREELSALGSTLPSDAASALLSVDITLNADGLVDWMCRRAREASGARDARGEREAGTRRC